MTTDRSDGPFVEALLAKLNRAEKLAQLQITFAMTAEGCADVARAGIGALFWPMGAAATNAVQKAAVEESAHGIPLLIGLDVIHGQRTIFPIPLAQACSFDPAVAETDGRVSAAEAASGGVNWTFAPMVDVSRDPRWGRVCEGFGEDALLSGVFGAAKVRGLQGASLSAAGSIAACAKHFVGYGAAEAGRDYNSVDISERRLRETYLRPFKRVVDAGVATVMASFNTINGLPVHAHRGLLTEVLKDEWGFGGVVVGDADGVRNLIPHGVAADHAEARRLSFAAGLDIEMGMGTDLSSLAGDLAELPDERLDDAVRRVLNLKLALGLFENPYVEESAEILAPTPEHLALAREAARRSAVLLKNDGTLPLSAGPLKVLLVGPYADSTDHLGAWVQHFGAPAGSLADALRAARHDLDLTVLAGASCYEPDPELQRAATEAAADADLVIVAVGEQSDLSGEASSRADLRLPGDQEALIHAIAATGTPFAVVLVTGRPLVVADWIDQAPSVLLTWHLGTQGAEAIADLLTGAANPGGRLAMGFPRAVGQLPAHYDHENTGRPAAQGGQFTPKKFDMGLDGPANLQEFYTSKYRDLELGPQFSFGHGLSYATFAHGTPSLTRDAISVAELVAGGRVGVRVEVTNTSERDGDEVVLVFVRDLVASLAQPVRRLAAFARVPIAAGETRTVELDFGFDELSFWAPDNAGFVVEPGSFEVHVGPTLDQTQTLTITL
ncbi:MAG TPA: glycoside hydrolase family 3 N-terminal domain-containing protein [Propionicimonas sp.]|nr:glycoside hydrolase family 3 N-terminal domain-containing protein [Propionicimonas sp.]HRA05856.1 glycoside hydrolase family 3 N-terminal domain-containing protein [Propionicimonas sp.]